MARIHAVSRDADPKTKKFLQGVEKEMGMVPNIVATMANSPAVAKAYLAFHHTLAEGSLPLALREQIALTVSEADQCSYCLSAHSFLGGKAGLNESEIIDARHATSSDDKTHAALRFARRLVDDRGHVSDEELEEVRRAGYSDGEIAEIVAAVALSIFTNYFNHVAETEIDFPVVRSLMEV